MSKEETTPQTKNDTPTTTGHKPNGQFAKGNTFNKLVLTHKPKTVTPEELANEANIYFNWCDNNPIQEATIHQKTGTIKNLPRIRAYTLQGLCNSIGITVKTLHNYANLNPETDATASAYLHVITRIKQICYQQKFEGAAAGQLNSNIIARDLGLTDRQQHEHTGDKKIKIELIPSRTESNPISAAPTHKETTGAPTIEITNEEDTP